MIEIIGVVALVALLAGCAAAVGIMRLRTYVDNTFTAYNRRLSALDEARDYQRAQLTLLDKSKANARRPRVRNVKLTETVPLGVPK